MNPASQEMPYTASVIFDFDLTIFPEESTLNLVQLAVAGNKKLERFIANYASRSPSLVGKIDSLISYLRVVARVNTENLNQCIASCRPKIDPVFSELMQQLRSSGVRPYVISSGYFELISPLLNSMGIPDEDIAANRFFWMGGNAVTIRPSPLHGSGGKVKIVEGWKATGKLKGPLIMVGDSLPDRKVYLHGLAEGFIQADYYTTPIDLGLTGNFAIASSPDTLKDQLFKLLDNVSPKHNKRPMA